ncbi:BQ2448_4535 [Microbotryum intermedium]|uniref:BQ2448_4535 protein n=1 Tax=Microbotryum intermedium TaxID=269621 RepID=A0A238FI66_9BASI|nr:BQ2448_4535 [Microbotryum intermedium]
MFGNYLGIGNKGSPSGPHRSRPSKASPDTRCQKCEGLGHYTYECTGQRERPTRTQQLKNPKLLTKLTGQAPPTERDPKSAATAATRASTIEALAPKELPPKSVPITNPRSKTDSFSFF